MRIVPIYVSVFNPVARTQHQHRIVSALIDFVRFFLASMRYSRRTQKSTLRFLSQPGTFVDLFQAALVLAGDERLQHRLA